MTRRSKSSDRWLREHFTDPYVKRAKAQGWRSRAVFKLEEIDRGVRLLKPGMVVLDLGAAPGAWSQYARRQVGKTGRVLASDILPMDDLAGVEFLQGDFREQAVLEQLKLALGDTGVDVLLSDMAPNLSGMDAIDAPRSLYFGGIGPGCGGTALETGRPRPDQIAAGCRLSGICRCGATRIQADQAPEAGCVTPSQS